MLSITPPRQEFYSLKKILDFLIVQEKMNKRNSIVIMSIACVSSWYVTLKDKAIRIMQTNYTAA
jgi:hypothetical protein